MILTRWSTPAGPRWALDDKLLAEEFSLALFLNARAERCRDLARLLQTELAAPSGAEPLAPVDAAQEIWASGVTYRRSREARMHESDSADIYDKVYDAERPELFFKAQGWRARGPGQPIRVRHDAGWNVPEPELTLVINRFGDIVGYSAGNDVSSRDIEGANPLYLPQAKVYNGSCALGPAIVLADAETMADIAIGLDIRRDGESAFYGETAIAQMKRGLAELAECLFAELDFPAGALLMTGAGIVPGDDFTLRPGDTVTVTVADLSLTNPVGE